MIIHNTETNNIEFRRQFKFKKALKSTAKNIGMAVATPVVVAGATVGCGSMTFIGATIDIFKDIKNSGVNPCIALPIATIAGAALAPMGALGGAIVTPVFMGGLIGKSIYKGAKNIKKSKINNEYNFIKQHIEKLLNKGHLNELSENEKTKLKDILKGSQNAISDPNDKISFVVILHKSDIISKLADKLGATDDNREAVENKIWDSLNLGTEAYKKKMQPIFTEIKTKDYINKKLDQVSISSTGNPFKGEDIAKKIIGFI